MPSLTMRGRYLMREYWSDTDLFTKLNADQRELYQGLWMLADDDGFLPRDLDGIGAALYRFMDRTDRIAKIRAGLLRLRDIGKLNSYRCGCLYLQAVAKYPRAGKKNTEHSQKHQSHSNRFDDSDSKHSADLKGFESIQTDLNPSPVPTSSLPDPTSRARANGAAPRSKFRELVSEDVALGKAKP